MSNKVIIFSAPSGSGKSTIVSHILKLHPEMEFSVSATSRAPRGQERNGIEYHFFTADEFRKMIAEDKFVEYEEVYAGSFFREKGASELITTTHSALRERNSSQSAFSTVRRFSSSAGLGE